MDFPSKFERFIRNGGAGQITIPWSGSTGPAIKASVPADIHIESLIGHADADNIAYLQGILGTDAKPSIEGIPIDDLGEWAREELRRRLSTIESSGIDDDPVWAGIIRQFNGKLNARRQQALGVSHYIWRSQDDNRVRSTHVARDDQVFSWDEPLPGGFPGEDFGCRCWAEPVISHIPCHPKSGLGLAATLETAALVGYAEAARDFGFNLIGDLFDLAKLALNTIDYGISELAVLLGIAGDQRQDDVERVHAQIASEIKNYDKWLEQLANAIAGLPDLAAAFLAYADAIAGRAAEMRAAYLRCEVSESELREAIHEEAYLKASVAIAIVPAVGLVGTITTRSRKLLRVMGDDAGGLNDAQVLRKLTDRSLAPALPRGFHKIDANGVDWNARSVKDRGLSYERSLAERTDEQGRGTWLEQESRDHPKVDFFNFETGQATSVKTLDLNAYSYRKSPSQVYAALGIYVRDLADFNGGRGLVRSGEVEFRVLNLAVPLGTTRQMSQIQRAVDLAKTLGVELIVEVTG